MERQKAVWKDMRQFGETGINWETGSSLKIDNQGVEAYQTKAHLP
jgi:hypothetical protein